MRIPIPVLCILYSPRAERAAGGADRDRTDDLKLAKLALSQLSYGPIGKRLVGPGRVERPTSRLSGVRSNHLSYEPVPENGIQKSGDQKVVTCAANEVARRSRSGSPFNKRLLMVLTSDSTEGRETKGAAG